MPLEPLTTVVCSRITCRIVALGADIFFGPPRCLIDTGQVATVMFSTMGNPNMLLELTNSAPLGRTARLKLVFFRCRWAKI